MIRASDVPIVILTNAGYRSLEGGEMRGFDCSDPSHGKIHFTGKDDDDLVQTIKAHAATADPGDDRGGGLVEGDGHLGRERRLGAIRIRRVSGPPKGPGDS
jgi:hypothetical protein